MKTTTWTKMASEILPQMMSYSIFSLPFTINEHFQTIYKVQFRDDHSAQTWRCHRTQIYIIFSSHSIENPHSSPERIYNANACKCGNAKLPFRVRLIRLRTHTSHGICIGKFNKMAKRTLTISPKSIDLWVEHLKG